MGRSVFRCFTGLFAATLAVSLASLAPAADRPATTRPASTQPASTQPASAPSKLPRVLLIGDSISLGYTPIVRAMLEGKAVVVHPPGNCQFTGHGLKSIKAWLGDEKWDVIHFNWGIWDTHMLDANGGLIRDEASHKGEMHIRYTPEEYRQNLESLVKTMEATGAKLVWASTTPVFNRTGARFEDIKIRNAIAAEVMKAHGIPTDDLYAVVEPAPEKLQGSDKVHFTKAGSEELARHVVASVLKAMGKTGE